MGKLSVERLCRSAEECLGWPYVSPGTNDARGIDCSGLFVKCYRDQGASIYHGSNSIFHSYCSETGRITSAGQLRPGMAVFKCKAWTDSESDRKNKWYGKDPGNLSHIGMVVGVNPLRIIHASTGTMCVTTDSKVGTWKYWGKLKDVDYGDGTGSGTGTGGKTEQGGSMADEYESRIGSVFVGAGKTVKLRSAPSQKSSVYWNIPHGNRIEVNGEKDGWSHATAYDNTGKIRTGWMMSQYIIFADDSGGTIADDGGAGTVKTVTLALTMPENVAASIMNQIAAQIGKG